VRKKDDGKIFAMKALKKRTLIMKKQLRYAISEANVLKMSNHPFVLGLHYAFQVNHEKTFFNLKMNLDKRKLILLHGLLPWRRSFLSPGSKNNF